MFSLREVPTAKGILQYREEHLTGLTCRISPDRLNRHIDRASYVPIESDSCPFCRENVFSVTPTFQDGNRIIRGESVTFPNLFPFGENHIVTVITREHTVQTFTHRQIVDALSSQIEALRHTDGYASINWNFLPSAGASLYIPICRGCQIPVLLISSISMFALVNSSLKSMERTIGKK